MTVREEIEFLRKAAADLRKVAREEPAIAARLTEMADNIEAQAKRLEALRPPDWTR